MYLLITNENVMHLLKRYSYSDSLLIYCKTDGLFSMMMQFLATDCACIRSTHSHTLSPLPSRSPPVSAHILIPQHMLFNILQQIWSELQERQV